MRGPHPHPIANSEIHTKQGQHLGREMRFWWVNVLCWQNKKRKKDREKKLGKVSLYNLGKWERRREKAKWAKKLRKEISG